MQIAQRREQKVALMLHACFFSLGTPLPALDAIKGTVLSLSSSEGHCLRQMPLEDLKSKPDQAANEKRETD